MAGITKLAEKPDFRCGPTYLHCYFLMEGNSNDKHTDNSDNSNNSDNDDENISDNAINSNTKVT